MKEVPQISYHRGHLEFPGIQKTEKKHAGVHVSSRFSVNISNKMSQVILYLLTELTRKLRELMFAPGAPKMALKRKAEDTEFDFRLDEPDAKREAYARSRLPTLLNVDGSGQCIAVLTSGGDAQGMNNAIDCSVYFIVFSAREMCKLSLVRAIPARNTEI